jgi:hypothetical protein
MAPPRYISPMLDAITDYLKETYQPQAILLHGSRARGDAAPSSDYDLTLIGAKGFMHPAGFKGAQLDLSAEPADVPVLLSHEVPTWPIQVLYDDKHGYGAALAARTEAAFREKPPRVPEDKIMNRKNYMRRIYARICERGENKVLRTYYMGDLVERCIRYRAELRREWPQSLHASLIAIKAEDPHFHDLLERLTGDDYIAAVAEIFRTLFDEPISG